MPVPRRAIGESRLARRPRVTGRRASCWALRPVDTRCVPGAQSAMRTDPRRFGVTRANSRRPFSQVHAVDVDVVVPVVERRVDRPRERRQRMRPRAGVVVRLVVVGRREAAWWPAASSAALTSRVPQPVKRSRPDRAHGAAGRGVRVVGASLEQPRDLLGAQGRVLPEQERGRGRHLRRRERRADRVAELERPAVGVRMAGAGHRGRVDELERDRREDRVARSGEVVVDRVAVRVVGHRAVLPDRADADHVRQRRRIVREVPRRRGRLRAVADRRHDDGALRVGVLDGGLLERRVGVEARVERIAHAAEAEVDHARAVVDGPADRGDLGLERDRPVGSDDLRDHQLRVERHAGDALVVERVRGDLPRDERAVPLLVGVRRAADEGACAATTRPTNSGCVPSMPGVDHRDLDRNEAVERSASTSTRGRLRGTTASRRAARGCRTRTAAGSQRGRGEREERAAANVSLDEQRRRHARARDPGPGAQRTRYVPGGSGAG